MEWCVDSHEWVMYGNIYGMVSNDIKIMKKNYICSSNYIIKMSDYKRENWDIIFDCLYYNYINISEKNNYSNRFQISIWRNKSLEEKKNIITIANKYINSLYK